jgi:hypothetical protein
MTAPPARVELGSALASALADEHSVNAARAITVALGKERHNGRFAVIGGVVRLRRESIAPGGVLELIESVA